MPSDVGPYPNPDSDLAFFPLKPLYEPSVFNTHSVNFEFRYIPFECRHPCASIMRLAPALIYYAHGAGTIKVASTKKLYCERAKFRRV